MKEKLDQFTISPEDRLLDALKKIDSNKLGFVICLDNDGKVIGVMTDGDARRALINQATTSSPVKDIFNRNATIARLSDGFESVTELFKNPSIKFLPIVDDADHLINIITKPQFHTFLLQDIQSDLSYDFLSLDTSVLDNEINNRPWGFYKTTVLTDYYQAKILTIRPSGKLSLQSHLHREEYWIIVHGKGTVQLEESSMEVSTGSTVFIPKGAKHRISNTDDNEDLILTEVQIGDYLAEDDIVRYEDVYGRA